MWLWPLQMPTQNLRLLSCGCHCCWCLYAEKHFATVGADLVIKLKNKILSTGFGWKNYPVYAAWTGTWPWPPVGVFDVCTEHALLVHEQGVSLGGGRCLPLPPAEPPTGRERQASPSLHQAQTPLNIGLLSKIWTLWRMFYDNFGNFMYLSPTKHSVWTPQPAWIDFNTFCMWKNAQLTRR